MQGPRQDPWEMDWETFGDLAGAYGADLRRWPADQRLAAEALMRRDRPRAEAVLARERRLDHLLAQAVAPMPGDALRAAVLAAAPQPRDRRRCAGARLGWGRPLAGAGLLTRTTRGIAAQPLLSGAAAAAMCAGLLCGVVLTRGIAQTARQDALAAALQGEAPALGDATDPGAP